MLTTLALILGALLLVILTYAATRPGKFQISRTASIKAPPERIFPLINDLKALNTWNPFLKHDPDVKIVYSGPANGKGAAHEWAGNKNAGKGRITISDSVAPSRVTMELEMIAPMAAQNTVVFALVPKGGTTDVTWAMDGRNSLLSKIMCLFISSDKMVGGAFEKGLSDLKTLAEK